MPLLQTMTVIGVVENEIQGADLGAPAQPMVYIDYLQLPENSMLAGVFSMAAQYAKRARKKPVPPQAHSKEILLGTKLAPKAPRVETERYTSFPRWKIGSTPVARARRVCSSCCSRGL
jgi:hypothetical protein